MQELAEGRSVIESNLSRLRGETTPPTFPLYEIYKLNESDDNEVKCF